MLKKKNQREIFDRDKLERSIRIALQKRPIQSERIEQMITGIVRRLESIGDTDIKSEIIGKIVMETLSRIDTVAYVRLPVFTKIFKSLEILRILCLSYTQEKLNQRSQIR
ncbi:MAG: hypothetical protein CM15mP98_01170 [Paracoccaceae bacterium]|nr:MAG: hypothetical protein CM15mP98_01170 [Paracoccaceae bacterium]